MNPLLEKTYFDVVSVEDELPKIQQDVNRALYYMTNLGKMWIQPQNNLWYFGGMSVAREQPEIWLKEKKGYLLSKEELIDLLNDLMTYSLGYEDKEYLQGFLNDKGLK